MYYKVDLLKLKNFPSLRMEIRGQLPIDLTKVSPKNITIQDVASLTSYTDESTLVKNINSHAKITYANGSQNKIISLEENNGFYIFPKFEDIAEYLALIDLKVKTVFVKCATSINNKIFVETTYADILESIQLSQQIDWSVPKFEVVNDWDSKEFNISFLTSKSVVDYQEFFKYSPQEILLDKEVMSIYVKSDTALSSLPRSVRNSEQFNLLVTEDFDLFIKSLKAHIKYDIKEALQLASKNSENFVDIETYNTGYIDILTNSETLNKDLFSDNIKNAIWFKENLFNNKAKLIDLINWHYDNVKAKSLSSFMEVVSLFNREFLKDTAIQDLIRKSYRTYSFDYGSSYLKNYIPSDYFDSPEVCKDFIRSELSAGLVQSTFLFGKPINNHLKSDIDFIRETLDIVKKISTNSSDSKKACANIVMAFRDFASYETKKSVEFFILLLDHIKVDLSSWSYGGSFSHYYETYLMTNKELKSYIELNGIPEHLISLPLHFIHTLTNRTLIKSLIKIKPSILTDKKAPIEWIFDLEYLIECGQSSHEVKLKKTDYKKIVTTKEVAIKLVNSNAFMFTKFPKAYTADREVALLAISKKPTMASFCEPSLLLERSFCIDILKAISTNGASIIPDCMFYDSLFMTEMFDCLDDSTISLSIVNALPKDICQCLNAFKIQKGGYKDFASSFFNKQLLKNSLIKAESNSVKKLKI